MPKVEAKLCPHCRRVIVFEDGEPTERDYTATMVTAEEKTFLSNASPTLSTTLTQSGEIGEQRLAD